MKFQLVMLAAVLTQAKVPTSVERKAWKKQNLSPGKMVLLAVQGATRKDI